MGDILPFVARVRDRGDWTPEERSRLEELAQRFEAAGIRVDVVFGVTDDGDPWCVVKDENEEVLVHVARIGKAFVVHYALDDVVKSGTDLPAALGEQLAMAEEPEGEVVPFARKAQLFMALVVATAFFYESAAETPGEPESAPLAPDADAPPAPALVPDAAVDDRKDVLHAAVVVVSEDAPRSAQVTAVQTSDVPAAAPLSAAPAAEPASGEVRLAAAAEPPPVLLAAAAPRVIEGTAGDDLLVGTAASERLLGGDGDDTLMGGGGMDTLIGGAGNDWIELGAQVSAEGGSGADSFILIAPAQFGNADTLLGVIFDFRSEEGDRLITGDGQLVVVVEAGNVVSPPAPDSFSPTFGPATLTTTTPPDRRVEVDLNGDGLVDGYVLLTTRPPSMLPGAAFDHTGG